MYGIWMEIFLIQKYYIPKYNSAIYCTLLYAFGDIPIYLLVIHIVIFRFSTMTQNKVEWGKFAETNFTLLWEHNSLLLKLLTTMF